MLLPFRLVSEYVSVSYEVRVLGSFSDFTFELDALKLAFKTHISSYNMVTSVLMTIFFIFLFSENVTEQILEEEGHHSPLALPLTLNVIK